MTSLDKDPLYITRSHGRIYLNAGLGKSRVKREIDPLPTFKNEWAVIGDELLLFSSGVTQVFDSRLSLRRRWGEKAEWTPILSKLSTDGQYLLRWSGAGANDDASLLTEAAVEKKIGSVIDLGGFHLEERNGDIFINGTRLAKEAIPALPRGNQHLHGLLDLTFVVSHRFVLIRGVVLDQAGTITGRLPIAFNCSDACEVDGNILLFSPDNVLLADPQGKMLGVWKMDGPVYSGLLERKWPLIRSGKALFFLVPEKLAMHAIYRSSKAIAGCAFVRGKIWLTLETGYGKYSRRLVSLVPRHSE